MRRDLNNIEIVEPPLEEFTKKYSRTTGCKRGCLSGCAFFIVFIVGIALLLKFALGPSPQTIKTLPSSFPRDIPIYDQDNIEKITFISGQYKNRGIEIAALFPKIILSPLLITFNKGEEDQYSMKNIWKIITTPVGDHRDTVQIEWKDLNAEVSFVNGYYKNELSKKGYSIEVESQGKNMRQFSFTKNNISGSFYAKGYDEKQYGTQYAVLTINLENDSSEN